MRTGMHAARWPVPDVESSLFHRKYARVCGWRGMHGVYGSDGGAWPPGTQGLGAKKIQSQARALDTVSPGVRELGRTVWTTDGQRTRGDTRGSSSPAKGIGVHEPEGQPLSFSWTMAARQAARKALGLGATQHLAATTGHAKPTLFFREVGRVRCTSASGTLGCLARRPPSRAW